MLLAVAVDILGPEYPRGTVLVVANETPEPGDTVVAVTREGTMAVRRYQVRDGRAFLDPLGDVGKPVECPEWVRPVMASIRPERLKA